MPYTDMKPDSAYWDVVALIEHHYMDEPEKFDLITRGVIEKIKRDGNWQRANLLFTYLDGDDEEDDVA